MMQVFGITREEYIAVLETEVETLSRYYYKPSEGGTGHFNTAISVLQHRIEELKNGTGISDTKFVYRQTK
jgi:hypothetical protein